MRTEETKAITHFQTQNTASATPMKGKTVLFTGASRGMGRYASIELARRGAEILVVGHNDARGAAAVDAMRGAGGSAAFLRADMGDAEDVCALAEAVLARGGSIDVLIHSAGGLPPSAARTREGVDRGFAQNFLGAFLLTRLLEERLLASTPARVIAVGSAAHRLLKQVDIDAFLHPGMSPLTRYQMGNYQMHSYQVAKLAVTTWIYSLARRWDGRGVTANVLDPGMVKGEFGEQFEGPAPIRLMMNHVLPFFAAAGTERGSQQYVRLAADPTLVDVSGRYFVSGKEKQAGGSPLSRDPVVQQCINDAAEAWAAPFLRGRV
jgi:NAD(P)-dependent dehydrogenase (short-subunit alcohol dehydrogenase family)